MFTFIWKLENFSFLSNLSKNEEIVSPLFLADNFEKTSWTLVLRPPGFLNEEGFRFYLSKSSKTDPNVFNLDYELSVLIKPFLQEKSIRVNKFHFHLGNSLGTPLCITFDEIFKKREILQDDTLTIQCKMWSRQSQYSLRSGFSLARTRIDSERKFFTWNIDKFSSLQAFDQKSVSVLFFSSQQICLTITLSFSDSRGSYSNGDMHIELKGKSKDKGSLLMLGISVQDKNGKPAHHFQDEITLKRELETFSFPLILKKEELLEAQDLLLPGDVLSLKCDMVTYYVVLNRIELSGIGRDSELEVEAALSNTNPPFRLGKKKRHSNSLTNDLRYLFEEKQHADVSLRVLDETFSVHKTVLAARSSVFNTMFDTDMKEKQTNVIEIDDIEPDTMRRLLIYIYSENLDNIQWENVSRLYLAADKYAVLGLKEECSSYLMVNISTTNVCETLVLADMVNDEFLKDFVLRFIQDKCKEVLNSDEWKIFAQEHPQMTIDILTRLYKNLKKF